MNKDFAWFVNNAKTVIFVPVAQLIFALTVTYLVWNIAEVIRKSDRPEERAKLKDRVIWGIVALAVMLSLWGLVHIFTGSVQGFGVNTAPIQVKVIGL